MINPHVARLDRQLRLHGEDVQLVKQVSASPVVRCTVKGIVKTYGVQKLIASITQNVYLVIISPSELRRKGFPGAIPVAIPTGVIPNTREDILPTTNDSLVVRGVARAVQSVDAIYDGNEVVRIEIKVIG